MNPSSEAIRKQQEVIWNAYAPKWKKWDALLMRTLQPVEEATIRLLALQSDDRVLDIASGTGEPGITIAETLPNGYVTLTDNSENMLTIAWGHATRRKITNIETRVCDACQLPFSDRTFDAISCRLGLMFVPDLHLATQEMYRVLKPGSKAVISVWNSPDKNQWATLVGQTIRNHVPLSPPSPDAPGLFRCAAAGLVRGLLTDAGFSDTTEEEVTCTLRFPDAATYWTMVTEVTAPIAAALAQTDGETKMKIRSEVLHRIDPRQEAGEVVFSGSTTVIAATK